MKNKCWLVLGCGVALVAGCAVFSGANDWPCVSGVYPHLATFNNEGECGTGAVVPWAGSLWHVSYAPHAPCGSSDKLYQVKGDLSRVIRPESIGGTPANRMIHKESAQLFIGPYAIDAKGQVRTMPPKSADGATNLYGRLTACARHLTDPANKIYHLTMEEGVYEVDVKTLAVKELFRDGNIQPGDLGGTLLPGYHGKGAYSGQGLLVYANNGERGEEAARNPRATAGALAQWNGKDWELVLRNQFTDVTGPGGIRGNADPAHDPLWSVGWDYKSVMLMVLENGKWTRFRLPKGSHSYDGAHGWNTEWPRIREIGEGDDFLMTMHGTFWHFPKTFSATNSAGIRPRSNYLKIVGDFCRWGDKVVLGCDDSAKNEFMNKRSAKGGVAGPRQSNSNLWFVDPAELDHFGPAIGRGSVWLREDVKSGQISDPYLVSGFDHATLYLSARGQKQFLVEIDRAGTGAWEKGEVLFTTRDGRVLELPLEKYGATWLRLVATEDAQNVCACFQMANDDARAAVPGIGKPVAKASGAGLVASLAGGDDLKLGYQTEAGQYYELDKTLAFSAAQAATPLAKDYALKSKGVTGDGLSGLVVDDAKKRWRLPVAAVTPFNRRLCREVCTERDLLNVGGTFFELPAENAGGYAKLRPVASHALGSTDYCTWRGLFVLAGADPRLAEVGFGRTVKTPDGAGSVWLGVADDLWKLGKPVGAGSTWKNTPVKAGEPSDPMLMTGYDRKLFSFAQTGAKKARVTLEFDLTGEGDWRAYKTYDLGDGARLEDDLSASRAYWWRVVSDVACTATATVTYR